MITATVLMTISCKNGFISERMIDDDGKNEHVAWSKRLICEWRLVSMYQYL
jgi:hypothetical protein